MNKWLMCLVLVAFGTASSSVSYAASGPDTPVDALIEKLIDKGVLTADEGEALKSRVIYDNKVVTENAMKTGIPEWVQNTKIGGDMRVRLQSSRRVNSGSPSGIENTQGRMRARLNVETKVNDKAKVVVGIATTGGANNARSNNVTFSGDSSTEATGKPFAKTNVVLNKAYGQYQATDRLSLMAGKMDNPIWEPMEFLWDSDITPEGGSVRYDYKVNDKVSAFGTGSLFVLNNVATSTSDPLTYVLQGGVVVKPCEKADLKLVGTYQGYSNIKSGFTGSRSNNTAGLSDNGSNSLMYRFSAPMISGELGFNDPLPESFPLYIPRVGIFGEYTMNPHPKTDNVAWMGGLYAGNTKVNGWKTWKATAAYKSLERDAWLDILPDSDFYSGNTGVKGLEGIVEIGLAKNLSFAFDYYATHRMKVATKNVEHLFQADINWKF